MTTRDELTPARDTSGQALVELALVAPLLLLFVLGMLLFGRIFQAKVAISAAGREAARTVAEASAESSGLSRAQQRAHDVIVGADLSVDRFQLTIDDGGFVRGGTVTVQTRYAVPVGDLPLIGQVIGGGSVTVSSTDQEMIEQYRAHTP